MRVEFFLLFFGKSDGDVNTRRALHLRADEEGGLSSPLNYAPGHSGLRTKKIIVLVLFLDDSQACHKHIFCLFYPNGIPFLQLIFFSRLCSSTYVYGM